MPIKCSECQSDKPKSQFSKSQLRKGPSSGKKCRECASQTQTQSQTQVSTKAETQQAETNVSTIGNDNDNDNTNTNTSPINNDNEGVEEKEEITVTPTTTPTTTSIPTIDHNNNDNNNDNDEVVVTNEGEKEKYQDQEQDEQQQSENEEVIVEVQQQQEQEEEQPQQSEPEPIDMELIDYGKEKDEGKEEGMILNTNTGDDIDDDDVVVKEAEQEPQHQQQQQQQEQEQQEQPQQNLETVEMDVTPIEEKGQEQTPQQQKVENVDVNANLVQEPFPSSVETKVEVVMEDTTKDDDIQEQQQQQQLEKTQEEEQPQQQQQQQQQQQKDQPEMVTPTKSSINRDAINVEIPIVEEENEEREDDENEVEEEKSPSGRIRVGICAMDKKARSKPMAEILSRLDKEIFEIVEFGDNLIRNAPVEQWPMCDVLIAFYSTGYPLEKAEKYAELHPNIFVLNDLRMQRVLMDRRRVYDLLEASGIDVPRHVFMNRDPYVPMTNTTDLLLSAASNHSTESIDSNNSPIMSDNEEDSVCSELIEHDDHIEVNGVVIHKPFVEKPVDADDHNIAIYYPYSAGGGCKKLFRKIGDRSSEFYPHINEVRRDGSFIYEEYVETQGIDVKMYTVGPDYGHAEARKSPTVDGKVERNADGKEVRFPVILTLREKEIARRIVMVFKQQVCGFDLLRVQEGDSLVSYVCDVNGWSFVKKSKKYYDDCATIISEHMLAAVKPVLLHGFSALNPLLTKVKDSSVDAGTPKRRRPQTFSRTKSDSIVGSPDKNDDQNSTTALENSAFTLAEGAAPVRQIADMLMDDPSYSSVVSSKGDDESTNSKSSNAKQVTKTHQEELRCVITVVRHGDRTPKQKLKAKMSEPLLLKYFHDHTDNCKKELKVKDKRPMTEFLHTVRETIAEKQQQKSEDHGMKKNDNLNKLLHTRDVLERWKIGGLNRKMQMKPTKWGEFIDADGNKIIQCTQLQLILKWGGNLTKLGEKQAINLGKRLRQEIYPDEAGGGILRLHSTFRHDLKIKTSDEGRVMKTAAAFAKGLLELEGEIPPILVSLVHKERNSTHMLDPSGNKEVKKELDACKVEVNKNLQQDFDMDKVDAKAVERIVGPPSLKSLHSALRQVGNPRKTLFAIHAVIGVLLEQLDEMLGTMTSDMEDKDEGGEGLIGDEDIDETLCGIKLYKGETFLELTERWRLLYTKLYDEEEDEFDLSRVPDVHDNVRFDMLHNPHLGLTGTLEKLYTLAKLMADCVVPQEYGTTVEQKIGIGNKMCGPLIEKLLYDLIIARTDNQVDMRYMINLQYSADLPINTMGRRIRTRLYFTSESHLHTLLNVLRFASSNPSSKAFNPLSQQGIEIVSNAPELCYLTQIVIRLFENTSKELDDPKRYRVEIFFSPGATATPLHMSELKRDADTSRFDTEPLQLISKPYLTCKELEEYFTEVIKEGLTENEEDEIATTSVKEKQNHETKEKIKNETPHPPRTVAISIVDNKESTSEKGIDRVKSVTISEDKNIHIAFADSSAHSTTDEELPSTLEENDDASKAEISPKQTSNESLKEEDIPVIEDKFDDDHVDDDHVDDKIVLDEAEQMKEMAKVLGRQYFWTSVAAVSFVLGIGCLILSREIVQRDFKTRRWTRR